MGKESDTSEQGKKVAIGARVPPPVAERIEELANADDRTVSYIASLILEDWFAKGGKLPPKPKPRR